MPALFAASTEESWENCRMAEESGHFLMDTWRYNKETGWWIIDCGQAQSSVEESCNWHLEQVKNFFKSFLIEIDLCLPRKYSIDFYGDKINSSEAAPYGKEIGLLEALKTQIASADKHIYQVWIDLDINGYVKSKTGQIIKTVIPQAASFRTTFNLGDDAFLTFDLHIELFYPTIIIDLEKEIDNTELFYLNALRLRKALRNWEQNVGEPIVEWQYPEDFQFRYGFISHKNYTTH